MQYTVTIPGPMKGKGRPRATSRGGHVRMFTPAATENAEAHVKQCCIQQIGQPLLDGPISLEARLDVAIPASWPKKKQAAALSGGLRPTGKPDLDNCLKLMCDALNGLAWRDDAQVVGVRIIKTYAAVPQTVLKITPHEVQA